jgi:hypothetical protein
MFGVLLGADCYCHSSLLREDNKQKACGWTCYAILCDKNVEAQCKKLKNMWLRVQCKEYLSGNLIYHFDVVATLVCSNWRSHMYDQASLYMENLKGADLFNYSFAVCAMIDL